MEGITFYIDKKKSAEVLRKKRGISPIVFIIATYLLIILVGATLLSMPFSNRAGKFTPLTDSLFTATSAVAVTGLVVKDTGTYFSLTGHAIILILIQIGGLGYMTLFTFFVLIFRGRIDLRQKIFLKETLSSPTITGVLVLARRIFGFVVIFEGIGALLLALRFMKDYPLQKAAWMGVFHAVSAFNNAGFDIMGNFYSFSRYSGDIVINLVIPALIILGGIGFVVLNELLQKVMGQKQRLSLLARVAIKMSILLILLGSLFFFAIEQHNPETLGNLSLKEKVLASFFHSVTARTAGFSTLPVKSLTLSTLIVLMIFMFIGASPGGTGGGIKTSTAAVLMHYLSSCIKRKNYVRVEDRRVSYDTVNKAVALVASALIIIITVTFAISLVEQNFNFISILFEVVSAFGTVGLSTGITPLLSTFSKILITFTMFYGRVGILAIVLSFVIEKKIVKVIPPKEDLAIG